MEDVSPVIAAILQARMSSTRLPGKVMKPLMGKPMLQRQMERIRRAKNIDMLVVATSTDASDNPIETLCKAEEIFCFRGSLTDVLDRYVKAAKAVKADQVMRLTGDCPLADPALMDVMVTRFSEESYDYMNNVTPPTYPDGLDVEIMTVAALEKAWTEAQRPSEREHVTPYITKHPALFKLGVMRSPTDLSALRWTVDEPDDFKLVETIYEQLYPQNPAFTSEDILAFLETRPELKTLNTRHARNEGYARSLREETSHPPKTSL